MLLDEKGDYLMSIDESHPIPRWVAILTAEDGAKQVIVYRDAHDHTFYFKKGGDRCSFTDYAQAEAAAQEYLRRARRYLSPRLITDKNFSIDEYERQMAEIYREDADVE